MDLIHDFKTKIKINTSFYKNEKETYKVVLHAVIHIAHIAKNQIEDLIEL